MGFWARRIAAVGAATLCLSVGVPVPAHAAATSSRCEPLQRALVDKIEQGLVNPKTMALGGGWAVKSKDFKQVYFVSVVLSGPALAGSDGIGTWATNRLDGTGLVYAIDATAKTFTDWGSGDRTDARMSMSDDGASLSERCTKQSPTTKPTVAPDTAQEAAFRAEALTRFGYGRPNADGSSLDAVALAKSLCAQTTAEHQTMRQNLGTKYEGSFNQFALKTFCPERS